MCCNHYTVTTGMALRLERMGYMVDRYGLWLSNVLYMSHRLVVTRILKPVATLSVNNHPN